MLLKSKKLEKRLDQRMDYQSDLDHIQRHPNVESVKQISPDLMKQFVGQYAAPEEAMKVIDYKKRKRGRR